VPRGSLFVTAGATEVACDRCRRSPARVACVAGDKRVGGTAVQQPFACVAESCADHVPHLVVGDVVHAPVGNLDEQAPVDRVFDRVDDLCVRASARRPEQLRVGLDAHHCRCRDHLACDVRGRRQPGQHQVADLDRGEFVTSGDGEAVLAQEPGRSTGALHERWHGGGIKRDPELRYEVGGVGQAQWRQGDAVHLGAPQSGGLTLRTPGEQHEYSVGRTAGEVADKVGRRGVEPVSVVHGKHPGPVGRRAEDVRDQSQDGVEQPCLSPRTVQSGRIVGRGSGKESADLGRVRRGQRVDH
jgi:hypothetical protein